MVPFVAGSSSVNQDYPVPLVIGVVGHRDLVADEIPMLRARVRAFFEQLREQFPLLPVKLLNPLAEGADRLVAEEALALNIPLIVPLPMPKEAYFEDFATDESRREFAELAAHGEMMQLPLLTDDPAQVDHQQQYAQLGVFVSSHCHVLLTLWDGKEGGELGGTATVIGFHQRDVMRGFADEPAKFRLIMADDESDLVYHIVCSRQGAAGAPERTMHPGEVSWYTTSEDGSRTAELPARYERIFRRAEEFNLDFAQRAPAILAQRHSLREANTEPALTDRVSDIDEMFGIADWLAVHYQKKFTFMLRTIHTLAVLMGLAFIAYSDAGQDNMIFAFLAFFGVAAGLYTLATRGEWHRKYLDYRGLAEGIRVQFYWAVAGVRSDKATKFTHDNFLQKQEIELGWIRNVMRVAGLRSDSEAEQSGDGLAFTMREWIGGDSEGQTSYYRNKAEDRAKRSAMTERLSFGCLLVGVLMAAIIAVTGLDQSSGLHSLMIVLMGILPMIAATRDAYAHKKAEKELIKQYRFMHQVFQSAARRLEEAVNDGERREILRVVGEAALDEHAEWILMHRERPLEMGKL